MRSSVPPDRDPFARVSQLRGLITPDLNKLEKRLMSKIDDLKAAVAANTEATKVMKARFETEIAALKAQLDRDNAALADAIAGIEADTKDELSGAGPSGSIPE
jgi:hypothetical protein